MQSLILAAILMIVGFQVIVVGLAADLIAANRRLSEETLLPVVRKLELSAKGEADRSKAGAMEASALEIRQ